MIEKHLHRKIGEEESHIYSGFVMLNSVFNGGKQVNSVPHKATAKYNVRTVPEYDSTFVNLFEKVIRHVGEDYLTVDIPSSHDQWQVIVIILLFKILRILPIMYMKTLL